MTDGPTDRPTDRVRYRVACTRLKTYLTSFDVLFLDATSHLYKRSCPSVRPSVRRSVMLSVTLSLFRSSRSKMYVWPCFFYLNNRYTWPYLLNFGETIRRRLYMSGFIWIKKAIQYFKQTIFQKLWEIWWRFSQIVSIRN